MTKLERLRKYQLGGNFDFVSANEELSEQLNLPFQTTLVPEMLNPLEGNAITGIKMPDINKELKLVNQAPSVNSSPSESSQLSPSAMSGIATAGIEGVKAIDQALMGDKNFGALSEAIDSAVHMTSSALMLSGNPYCVCEGTLVYTNSGYKTIENVKQGELILGYDPTTKQSVMQKVTHVFEPHFKECVQIETACGNILRCSSDHPLYSAKAGRAIYYTVGKKKQRRIKNFTFKNADCIKEGDFLAEIGNVPFFGHKHVKLAYLIGMLIGDGTYGKGKSPRLFTGDPDTWKYVESTGLATLTKAYTDFTRYNSEFREYKFNGFQSVLKEHGIYEQTKKAKRLPIDIEEWDKESCAALIAGLIDTDGFVEYQTKEYAGIGFSQANLELLKQVKCLLLKFGIHSTIQEFKSKKKYIKGHLATSGITYTLTIKRRESVINFYNNITLNIRYKQNRLNQAYLLKLNCKGRDTSFEFLNIVADRVKKIIPLGFIPVYNIEVSDSHTFVANNIVTHNCMAAAAALEGANFLTKAGGQTVQGYDVDIASSGYGTLNHMESKSSRDFGAAIGLGGLNKFKMDKLLARRNLQALMALEAADIAEEQKFEQEARMNSVENVIQRNQAALNGDLDTSLLGA